MLNVKKIASLALCWFLISHPAYAIYPIGSGYDQGTFPASEVDLITDDFDTNLSSTDTDVQKALDTLDDLVAGGVPGGSDTHVQFNDSSSFGGDAGMVFNKTTNAFTVSGIGTFQGAGNSEFGAGTKHDGYIISNSAEVQTTNSTITVLDTVTLLDENTYHIEAFVVAVQSTGAERASYHIATTVFRTGAGSATIQGTVTSIHTQESDVNLAATFTVSSNDVRVSVTGITAETWEWGSTLTYINMSN